MAEVKEKETNNYADVQINIAPFDELNVDAWFKILEAKFELHRISSDSIRYYHLLGNLSPSVLTKIPASSTAGNYQTLKKCLIDTYSKSRPELFEQLLQRNKINCTHPSQTLNEIARIGRQVNATDELIRHQFLQSLPAHVRSQLILHTDKTGSLDDLGRSADLIMNYGTTEKNSVKVVQPIFSRYFDDLQRSHTKQQIHNKNSNNKHVLNNPNKMSFPSTDIPFGLRPFYVNQRPRICRAHIYFGPSAKNCTHWCWLKNHRSL